MDNFISTSGTRPGGAEGKNFSSALVSSLEIFKARLGPFLAIMAVNGVLLFILQLFVVEAAMWGLELFLILPIGWLALFFISPFIALLMSGAISKLAALVYKGIKKPLVEVFLETSKSILAALMLIVRIVWYSGIWILLVLWLLSAGLNAAVGYTNVLFDARGNDSAFITKAYDGKAYNTHLLAVARVPENTVLKESATENTVYDYETNRDYFMRRYEAGMRSPTWPLAYVIPTFILALLGLIVFFVAGMRMVRSSLAFHYLMGNPCISSKDALHMSITSTKGKFWMLLAYNIAFVMVTALPFILVTAGGMFLSKTDDVKFIFEEIGVVSMSVPFSLTIIFQQFLAQELFLKSNYRLGIVLKLLMASLIVGALFLITSMVVIMMVMPMMGF